MPARISLPSVRYSDGQIVMQRIKTLLADIDDTFSTYKPESFISRYGRGEVTLDGSPAEVIEVFDLCKKVKDVTNGVFDIYVAATRGPALEHQGANGIEPSGLVKGWAIDKVGELLHAAAINDFCIDIAGDLLVSGRPEGGRNWQVALQHPITSTSAMAILELSTGSIATSAGYARGDHIIGSNELISVTVVGANSVLTDAYATAAFAMGMPGVEWLNTQPGFDILAVDQSCVGYASRGIRNIIKSPTSI